MRIDYFDYEDPFSQNIGCEYLEKVGTGKCTDVANNAKCGFDGGDCCGFNVNTDFCTQCICYEDLNCAAPLDLIGNNFVTMNQIM